MATRKKNVKDHSFKKNPAAHAKWVQGKKLRNSEGASYPKKA